MISTANLTVSFGSQTLFEEVSIKFLEGNCYGLIGANGAGKSTFLKILSGDTEPTNGSVAVDQGKSISVLKQDQFAYDEFSVLDTVLKGHPELYKIYAQRRDLYAKSEMTEEEGLRIGDLESEFADLDGYVAEANAATMLSELGIEDQFHETLMKDMDSALKVRVLLAQALFGDPDILLLDEPTNQLDYLSVLWLENYLLDFKNTVIVVSHDRHFLNKVCTHIADVDYKQIKIYPGNYDFWKSSSELAMQQQQDQASKDAAKVAELEDFVRRFSANASKSKQATSRKKLIDKIKPEDLPVSSRRPPYINFNAGRKTGTNVVKVDGLSHSIDGEKVLNNVTFTIHAKDKVAIAGKNSLSKTILLQILAGDITPDEGEIEWGDSVTYSYFPKDNSTFFKDKMSLFNWLSQFETSGDIQLVRGFLGRMLFSGDDVEKSVTVLSGGEKARAMFSKMMVAEGNTLLFDEPTDHLDLEAISALNDGLINYPECIIFSSHDFQLLDTVSNRVIEVTPKGFLDQNMSFDEYMTSDALADKRKKLY